MMYALDAANRLHHRQVEAATQFQDLVLKAVGGFVRVLEKAPQPPAGFTAPLEKLAQPVAKVVGTPHQIADYIGQTRRDWKDLRTRFQDEIASKFAEANPTVVADPTVVPEATVVAEPQPGV